MKTQSGTIEVNGCKMNLLNSETVNGTMTLRLPDPAAQYKMNIDTGAVAQIVVNGKTYPGGDFVLHEHAPKEILFDSHNGSLIITEAVS